MFCFLFYIIKIIIYKIPYDKIFLQSNVYYKGWFDDYDSLEVEVFDLNEDIKEQLFGGEPSYLN